MSDDYQQARDSALEMLTGINPKVASNAMRVDMAQTFALLALAAALRDFGDDGFDDEDPEPPPDPGRGELPSARRWIAEMQEAFR